MKPRKLMINARDWKAEAETAQALIVKSDLPGLIAEVERARYGFTHLGLDLLDAIERALAVMSECRKQLVELMSPPIDGFGPRSELGEQEARFAALFAIFAGSVEGSEVAAGLVSSTIRVENTFSLRAVEDLTNGPAEGLSGRVFDDLLAYIRHHRGSSTLAQRVDSGAALARCVTAYFRLLSATVRELAHDVSYQQLRRALEGSSVVLGERHFRGFQWSAAEGGTNGLLDISVSDIVGNADYLETCLATARDVAGFDFTAGDNPKTINPVLFALGKPGCGKTVTAHAVGRYFLDYCAQRNVPARFLQIRRTDWASSYQNASANALVRLFTEEVAAFEGVVAVYWPDIDTAFAARDDPRIRSEEKGILGACFGVFDGTLLAKNGKWFMMADANTLHMDEATVSRITQEPFILSGAETAEQMVHLLRDVKLKNHSENLELTEQEWMGVGRRLVELGLSGRAVDNIARKLVSEIESFTFPDEYFRADYEGRRRIIAECSRQLDPSQVISIIDRYGRFELESEQRSQDERHRRRVEEIVFNLSAEREAISRVRS